MLSVNGIPDYRIPAQCNLHFQLQNVKLFFSSRAQFF